MTDTDLTARLRAAVNDPAADPPARITALRELAASGTLVRGTRRGEVNNHVHTFYSFSPYSPETAVLSAYEAGLDAVGVVDHDSAAAARFAAKAGTVLGIAVTCGFEIRVRWTDSRFSSRKINFPDSPGRAYIVAHGLPRTSLGAADAYLAPIRAARADRTRIMTGRLSRVLASAGFGPLDFDRDVLPLSQLRRGGTVTERHLLGAAALNILAGAAGAGSAGAGSANVGSGAAAGAGTESAQAEGAPDTPETDTAAAGASGTSTQAGARDPGLAGLLRERLGLEIAPKIACRIDDASNPHRYYDLIGALKSGLLDRVWIDPSDAECPAAGDAAAFIRSLGAIPAYAYLGDVAESPTGDKKSETFEDAYLDEFIPALKAAGFQAVTYMPPRNTKEQLRRVRALCAEHGLMEISGVDINSSRQSFTCPEVLEPEYRHLNASTWALIAHEHARDADPERGLFDEQSPLARLSLPERIARYAEAGRAMDPKEPDSFRFPDEPGTTGGQR